MTHEAQLWGSTLAALASEPTLTCPLAVLSRTATSLGHDANVTFSAALRQIIDNLSEEQTKVNQQLEEYKLTRDKLSAELQRYDSLIRSMDLRRQEVTVQHDLSKKALAHMLAAELGGVAPPPMTAHRAETSPPMQDAVTPSAPVAPAASEPNSHHDSPLVSAAVPAVVAATPPMDKSPSPPLPAVAPAPKVSAEVSAKSLLKFLRARSESAGTSNERMMDEALLANLNEHDASLSNAGATTHFPVSGPNSVEENTILCSVLMDAVRGMPTPLQGVSLRIVDHTVRRLMASDVRLAKIMSANEDGVVGWAASTIKLLSSINDEVRTEACTLTTTLCNDPTARDAFVDGGVVPPLLHIISTSNIEVVIERSLTALWTAATSDAAKVITRKENGIPIVFELFFSESNTVLENAAIAIGYLTREDGGKDITRQCGGLEKLISLLYSSSESIQSKAAGALWNCAANPENKTAIRELGGIPPLIHLVTSHNEGVQENAAGALWNCAVDDKNKYAVFEYNGLAPLVELLSSKNTAVLENAAGTLWNCTSLQESRVALRKLGGIQPLLQLIQCNSLSVVENAAGALRNCVINDQNKSVFRELGGITLYLSLLDRIPLKVLEKLASTLWICSISIENKHAIRQTPGAFTRVLKLLDNESGSVREKAVGILRNCSSVAESRKPLLDCGTIAKLVGVLNGDPRLLTASLKEYSAAVICNIVRDDKITPQQQGAIEASVRLLADSSEAVVENAAATLMSLTIHPQNRDHVREAGGIELLARCLSHTKDTVLQTVVGALKNCVASNPTNQKLLRERNAIPRILELAATGTREEVVRDSVVCIKNLLPDRLCLDDVVKHKGYSIVSRIAESSQYSDSTRRTAAQVCAQLGG